MKKLIRLLVVALLSLWLVGTVACGGENPVSSDQQENSGGLHKDDGDPDDGNCGNGGGCENGGGSIIAG